MDVLLDCLSDENVEVREMASKVLSGVIRCSQRQNIIPLKVEFSFLRRTLLTFCFRTASLRWRKKLLFLHAVTQLTLNHYGSCILRF